MFSRHRRHWGLLARFAAVGFTGVLVNLTVFAVLVATGADPNGLVVSFSYSSIGIHWYHVFSTLAFLVANAWNFKLNRSWTFRTAGRAHWLREYAPFLTVGIIAQALGLVVLTLLVNPRSPISLRRDMLDNSSLLRSRELWAQAITLAVVMPVSFLANKLWTFSASGAAS